MNHRKLKNTWLGGLEDLLRDPLVMLPRIRQHLSLLSPLSDGLKHAYRRLIIKYYQRLRHNKPHTIAPDELVLKPRPVYPADLLHIQPKPKLKLNASKLSDLLANEPERLAELLDRLQNGNPFQHLINQALQQPQSLLFGQWRALGKPLPSNALQPKAQLKAQLNGMSFN